MVEIHSLAAARRWVEERKRLDELNGAPQGNNIAGVRVGTPCHAGRIPTGSTGIGIDGPVARCLTEHGFQGDAPTVAQPSSMRPSVRALEFAAVDLGNDVRGQRTGDLVSEERASHGTGAACLIEMVDGEPPEHG